METLLTKREARKLVGVSEKIFNALLIPYIEIGKRKRYRLSDIQAWINRQLKEPACPPRAKEKGRRITGTTSRSTVIGIEGALKLAASQRQSQSLQS